MCFLDLPVYLCKSNIPCNTESCFMYLFLFTYKIRPEAGEHTIEHQVPCQVNSPLNHERSILDLCLSKTRTRYSSDNRDYIVFEKLRFKNIFRPKAGVFKFLLFEERFRKAPFLSRVSVDGSWPFQISLAQRGRCQNHR